MNLKTMYKGVANSPVAYLSQPLASGGTVIYVTDTSVFGSLPNLAVIGKDQTAETILIKSKRTDGGLDVQRAIEGSAKDWPTQTEIARNFTNYDYQQLMDNLTALNDGKVDSVSGKGLSQNDYTNAEKAKVDGIPSNPKYTDTVYDDSSIKTRVQTLENKEDKDTTYSLATGTVAGLSQNNYTSTEKAKLSAIESGAQKNTVTSVQGRTGAVSISKADVGLGNVTNIGNIILTEAEYNALSDTQKQDTTKMYFIKA